MMISEAEIEAALDAYLGSKLWRTSAGVPGYRDAMRAALSAASAAREASGLVLVPMDPTEAMDPAEAMLAARKGSLKAYIDALPSDIKDRLAKSECGYRIEESLKAKIRYRAMISAVPKRIEP
jgi:hypothetical protein